MLTRQEARDFYDRSGGKQAGQSFYEKPAIERLIELGDFGSAQAVVEFGCGTGGFAERLMEEELPISATYAGFDLSETMTQQTRQRLVPWGSRVSVTQTDGRPRIPLPPASCDRFVANYVFDLLPTQDIARTLDQAWQILRPGGLLCVSNLTYGTTFASRLVIAGWLAVHSLRPSMVGGCRPLSFSDYLGPASWKILYTTTVVKRGVPSEILVARPRAHSREAGGIERLIE